MQTTKCKALFAIPGRYFLFTVDEYFLLNDINRIAEELPFEKSWEVKVHSLQASWKLSSTLGALVKLLLEQHYAIRTFWKWILRSAYFSCYKKKKKRKTPKQKIYVFATNINWIFYNLYVSWNERFFFWELQIQRHFNTQWKLFVKKYRHI